MSEARRRSVAILLMTYQGSDFLAAQLDSIAAQTHGEWTVWASDDGSTDGTLEILQRYRGSWGADRLVIAGGPGRGVDANAMSLIDREDIYAEAFAFADQDDVWEPTKLQRAVAWLERGAANEPLLYCSRTRLVDRAGHDVGLSPRFRRPASFANALVQNLAGGNTMVFNDQVRTLLRAARRVSHQAVIYDWWTYLLVTGAGGLVRYDPEPSVRYRQHGGNLVGSNIGFQSRAANFEHMMRGRLRQWTDRHILALDGIRHVLAPENIVLLDEFKAARRRWLLPRLAGFRRAGIYRQTRSGNLGLLAGAVFNKI